MVGPMTEQIAGVFKSLGAELTTFFLATVSDVHLAQEH